MLGNLEKKGDLMKVKGHDAKDKDCPKRWCWAPGSYQVRGATSSGSTFTGRYFKCCLHRAYHGCPYPDPLIGETNQEWRKRKELIVNNIVDRLLKEEEDKTHVLDQ